MLCLLAGGITACQDGRPTEDGVVRISRALEDGRAAVDGYFATPASFFVPPGNAGTSTWRYTFTAPPSNWAASSFNDSGWSTGQAGFGDGPMPGDAINTPWTTPDIWARRTFTVTSAQIPAVALWGRWDDYIDVYINGRLAASTARGQFNPWEGWTDRYRYLHLTDHARAGILASPAVNTIAVHVRDEGGGHYLDLGLTTNPMLNLPESGFEVPAVRALTDVVRAYMVEHVLPGGVFAVLKDDKLVVARGLGYANKGLTQTVPADAVMRLASVDKALTFTAARQLIAQAFVDPVSGQTITASTRVFPLLAAHGVTLLPGKTLPAGMNDITIQHIIAHRSGLNDYPSDEDLYLETGTNADTYRIRDGVRYLYSQPLRFPPGSDDEYSNAAPMVLRYLIGLVKGGNFEGHLQKELLGPAGSHDVFVARERLADRLPREIWYATLSEPWDRWIGLDQFYAIQTSGEALVRYARRWDMLSSPANTFVNPVTGLWTTPADTQWRNWGGVMAGSWAFVRYQVTEQLAIAVMFNMGGYFDPLIDRLTTAAAALPATAWGIAGPPPARQPVPNDAARNVGLGQTLIWTAGSGATSHEVRFGTSYPLPLRTTQSGTSYNPGALQPNTTYYWRIDEKSSAGTRAGTTWSFTTGAGGGGGPCADLCTSPIVFGGPQYHSGNLGTGATCHQTTANLAGANCGNFASGRTFKVNNVLRSCTNANITLPAKRNGGYCFQASAGSHSYAYFSTW